MANKRKLAVLLLEEIAESSESSGESEDSSDSEIEEVKLLSILRRDIPKILSFCDTVEEFDDLEFRKNFRIEKDSYNILCERLAPHLEALHVQHGARGRGRRQEISTKKKVLVGLWYFANKETIHSLAVTFGVANSTIHDIVQEFVASVMQIKDDVVRWPTTEEMDVSEAAFREFRGIPGIVGAIDGTYMPIPKPSGSGTDYINRKMYSSVNTQLTCDQNMKILDVYAGHPGSVHDDVDTRFPVTIEVLKQ
ncbi:unnamed protein product [Owenia fusiformis]|uniref:Uncharacterized protein n=1 Tax=Owenia fusiformis TaxID=6347 RepID=A0A8J1XMI8_OWEFU|nr:unnamed protein product [Owenia fusiformis]